MEYEDLQKLTGLDESRVDVILYGAIILYRILKDFQFKKVLISKNGLRNGILMDYIFNQWDKKSISQNTKQYRNYILKQIHTKYNIDKNHFSHCAKISVQIFDILYKKFAMDYAYCDILYAGVLLAEIGKYVNPENYITHTEYIILNSELIGFTTKQKYFVLAIAKDKNKGRVQFPDSGEKYFTLTEKEVIKKLIAIKRIAYALDKTNSSAVKKVTLDFVDRKAIYLKLLNKKDIFVELLDFKKKKEII